MKKFGLWLSILVVVLGLVATPFASRVVQIRSSWQKKTADAKAKVLDLRKKADDAEKSLENAKGELQRTIHGWERVWIAPQVLEGRQPGTLNVGLGTSVAFAPAGNVIPVVYAFQPSADGTGMSYVGSF